ncbi:glycine cleavage system aminomethyltransferase GcvT [uncultured Muribaculum sp.]|uniref:glycine cleavage system aminomethyltransferase GcvT n=1 Tax=uncultured Muribaculum sp. TaxID=1918613 RepID=UPI0025F7CB36|nr:glycine cleavage system aminomethyltransferase GcvT [uncultured Muribaculum sp.]
MESQDNKPTCLHSRHVALGALMSPFGGFDMPIQYAGIVEEHNAVRNACGVFDVSHMGEMWIKGADALKFVNFLFTNDITSGETGKCFYGMMLNGRGGVVDDLLVYKHSDTELFLVFNAANIEKDRRWISEHAVDYDVIIEDMCDSIGELAIQGPLAEQVVETVLSIPCRELAFYTFKLARWNDADIIVSRTGYTGEDGFEIYAQHDAICAMWDALIESGRCMPCGLGCRDTLRFEVGLPLYGDELTDDISPIEAGLGSFVKIDKEGGFIGRDAVAQVKSQGPARRLVGIELSDRAIPRHGYEVLDATTDHVIGHVTTGYHAISVDKSVAMALIESAYAGLDTPVRIRIRRKTFPGRVVKKRFYDKHYKK